ncbi:MAG: 4-hydroxybenzoate octaprenyltransferase [Alphaproteobacteria bacterium]|nr:4-hydroxybenzoate octaprenyltransferase [Alphaproteobacteria bacterium]
MNSFFTDIPSKSWIDFQFIPHFIKPYLRLMRLDRPIGIWLLLLPCWWGITLATEHGHWPSFKLLGFFTLGAILMRGAGCTINDLIDRKIDQKVERTAQRPIASGQISIHQAILFLLMLLILSFLILIHFNSLTIILGCGSLLLIVIYPWMKRFTWWPQAFLGITFNWGVLMGYGSVQNKISFSCFIFYLGTIFWTLVYDTIYAHQDKKDDLMIGVKSTALHFGRHNRLYLISFTTLMISLILISGWLVYFTHIISGLIFSGSILISGTWLYLSIIKIDFDNPKQCLKIFCQQRFIGIIIFLGLICANIIN